MHKAIKWIGIGLGSFAVIFAIVVAYIAATFNPNDYKADIIKAVNDKTGRTLQLKGDLGLSIFPTLGAKLGQASLSERKSDREFASIEKAVVAVKLMPLLSKEVVVDAIELKGMRANITRDKSGKLNFDDLTGADEKKKEEKKTASPVKIDIDHVEISDADVTYVDQAAGTQYRLSKLNVKTGRVASGVTTPLELNATITSEKDKSQVDTKVKGKLTFDVERQLYKLADLDFSAKGNYAGISGMNATAKGSVEARLATGEYVTNGLAVAITGKQAGGDMNVKVDAPKLTLTKDKVEGGKLTIDAKLNEPKSKLEAKIALGGVQGTFKAMKAGPLEADIEMHGDGRTIKAKLAGNVTGMKDLPTLIEGGVKGFDFETWYGLFGPAGLPRDVVTKLNASVNKVLAISEVKSALSNQGIDPAGGTTEAFDKLFRTEVVTLGKVIKASGAKPET